MGSVLAVQCAQMQSLKDSFALLLSHGAWQRPHRDAPTDTE